MQEQLRQSNQNNLHKKYFYFDELMNDYWQNEWHIPHLSVKIRPVQVELWACINSSRPIIVSDSTEKNDEEKKEVFKTEPCAENDFRIGDTEESRLFRKFINTWDSYFSAKQQLLVCEKRNTEGKKRRNRK